MSGRRRLPLAAAGLAAAVIAGTIVGRSAIADIDPAYFQGPLARPAAVAPDPAEATPDAFAQAYGWDEGETARQAVYGTDTADARGARPALNLAFAEPVRTKDAAAPAWRDVTPTTELPAWQPGTMPNRGLSVERYLGYPIEAETPPAAEAAPQNRAEEPTAEQ